MVVVPGAARMAVASAEAPAADAVVAVAVVAVATVAAVEEVVGTAAAEMVTV